MQRIEDKLSLFIKEQFPAFYSEDGETFRIFLKAYYEFLEQTGNSLDFSRNLLEYHDVDHTTDVFLDHFKKTYLADLPGLISSDNRLTIKNIMDFYRSKGSPRSIQLLFRIIFNEASQVSFPSDDVLKASSSEFRKPRYVEVYAPDMVKLVALEGLEIIGSSSGAKAFVETISTKVINGVRIHILQLSNLRGNFLRGEILANVNDGLQDSMPIVVGSLSDVNITLGGKNNKVGDTFDIKADVGSGAQARVTAVKDATGLIEFQLANGGFGFSTDKTFTNINVNDQNVQVNNIINSTATANVSFNLLEFVDQKVEKIDLLSAAAFNTEVQNFIANENNVNGPVVKGLTSGSTEVANGVIIGNTSIDGQNSSFFVAMSSGTFLSQKKLTGTKAVSTHTLEVNEPIDEENVVTLTLNASTPGTAFSVGNIITGDESKANGIVTAVTATSVSVNGSFGTFTANDNITNASATANVTNINVTDSGANGKVSAVTATTVSVSDVVGAFNTQKKIKGRRTNAIFNITNVEDTGASDIRLLTASGNQAVLDTVSNVSVSAQLIGSNTTNLGFRNTKFSDGSSGVFYQNTAAFVTGRDSGSSANVVVVGTGEGADFSIGTLENEESITIYTDVIGDNNVSNVAYLDCVIDGGNSQIGFLDTVTIDSGGTGYTGGHVIKFEAGGVGGGPPTTVAEATISVDGSGTILSATVTEGGSGYTSASIATLPDNGGGTDATVTGNFDFGYGFPKNDNGDFTTILDKVLTKFSGNVGTIAALSSINPGNNYNFDPFVLTRTAGIAKFDRRDIIVNLNPMLKDGGVVKPFIIGEQVTQEVTPAAQALGLNTFVGTHSNGDSFTPNTAMFDGKGVVQVINATKNAHGEVFAENTTHVSVTNVKIKENNSGVVTITACNEPFFVSATNTIQLAEVNNSVSSITAKIANVATTVLTQTSKGEVYKFNINEDGSGDVGLRRLSFAVGFNPSGQLLGSASQAGGTITSIYEDGNTAPIGFNANISADAQSANGIVTALEITDSGFGYQDGANLTLQSTNTAQPFVASGTANVTLSGLGPGYWASKDSFLNTKYIHDNDFYQEYSYVVESGLSLNKYRDILLKASHLAGTKLFGRVRKESLVNNAVTVSNSSITTGTLHSGNNAIT